MRILPLRNKRCNFMSSSLKFLALVVTFGVKGERLAQESLFSPHATKSAWGLLKRKLNRARDIV